MTEIRNKSNTKIPVPRGFRARQPIHADTKQDQRAQLATDESVRMSPHDPARVGGGRGAFLRRERRRRRGSDQRTVSRAAEARRDRRRTSRGDSDAQRREKAATAARAA